MTIADRIQTLRKAKGISQEELADKIGVSRQAVSKWESGQSGPDLEKAVLLSDYFEVTTDYLLKGKEPGQHAPEASSHKKPWQDARIYAAAGTAANFIGLTLAAIIWIETQTPTSVAAGFICFAVGCLIYTAGLAISSHNLQDAKKWFMAINAWIFFLIPITCIFNFIQRTTGGHWWTLSPFPQLYMLGSYRATALCWLCYFLACIAADLAVLQKYKKR